MKWFRNLFNKSEITIINEKWEIIKDNLKVNYPPRINEYINFNNSENYLQVINVIHVFSKNNKYLVVTKPVESKKNENK